MRKRSKQERKKEAAERLNQQKEMATFYSGMPEFSKPKVILKTTKRSKPISSAFETNRRKH